MAGRRPKGKKQLTPGLSFPSWLPKGDVLICPEELLFEQIRKVEARGIPKQWSVEMWPLNDFPREWTWHLKGATRQDLEEKWEKIAREDPFEAMIAIEEDLASLPLKRTQIWPKNKWQGSPFLLPKTEKNAEIINDILVKSWEIQGSSCQHISVDDNAVLMSGQVKDVHGMLLYYFKCLGVADNLKQVIGVTRFKDVMGSVGSRGTVYEQACSFLKTENGHILDNLFNSRAPPEIWRGIMPKTQYFDEDPADPKYDKNPEFRSVVGRENERILYSPDDQMERHIVLYNTLHVNGPFKNHMYDVVMRKYIKEKYGVEIESLIQKWRKLCWECGKPSEDLKKCSKCKLALYCSKFCQIKDWKKAHKLHHIGWSQFISEINNL